MAQKIATSLLYILLGFLVAALIDYGVTESLEGLGADAGDAALLGKLTFALFWLAAFWLALRRWRKPA